DATRGTTALEVRKNLAHLFTGPGVLPGAAAPLVQGSDGFAYVVRPSGWVTSRGAGDGVHLWGNDGDETISQADDGSSLAAPAPGLSRIDVVYALHPSADENGDTTSDPVLAVRKGSEASSPIPPALPLGALELARNTMTSEATSTSSAVGNTIAQTAARANLAQDHTAPVNLALASGWSTAVAGGGARWVKRGGLVWLGVTASRSSNASGLVNLATLPVEARPPFDVTDGGATNAGGGAPLQVLVGASGLVQVATSGDLNTGRTIRFTTSWPAAS